MSHYHQIGLSAALRLPGALALAAALLLVGGCGGGSDEFDPQAAAETIPPPIIQTLNLPDGVVGVDYSADVQANFGVPTFTWSISAGALPDGLSIDSSTGEISGTPTTAGTFVFTVRVTDGADRSDEKEFTVEIGNPVPRVERISVDSTEAEANGESGTPAVSEDGQFVAFTSFATNLVAGDTNNVTDVFLRDRECTDTIRVSVAGDGSQAGSQSFSPAVSAGDADVLFVAYASDANDLASGDTNGARDVFVTAVDVSSCPPSVITTARASVATDGTEGNGNSQLPSISADGSLVAYQSLADNLVEADANFVFDVFVTELDFAGGVITPLRTLRVSTFKALLGVLPPVVPETQADIFDVDQIGSTSLSLTADAHVGQRVEITAGTGAGQVRRVESNTSDTLFVTDDWSTTPDDTSFFRVLDLDNSDQPADIFSVNTIGNSSLALPQDQHTGQVVKIVGGTGQGQARIIASNTSTTFTVQTDWDTVPDGTSVFRVLFPSSAAASRGRLSADGTQVGFNTATRFEIADDNNSNDSFLQEIATAVTERVSVATDGTTGISASTISWVNGNAEVVLFQSSATNLVANDTNLLADLFVRDRAAPLTERVSLADDESEANEFSDVSAGLSGGGRLAAFATEASNLVAGDRNEVNDIFLRDRQNDTTTRLSLGLDGINADGESVDPAISLNGTTVVFGSSATNLVPNDSNGVRDIFAACSDGTLPPVGGLCGAVSDPAPIVVGQLRQPTQGTAYTADLLAVGGQKPYFWTLAEGELPPGLFLDPLSGSISGVPQKPGRYPFTMLVLDDSRPMLEARRTFVLTVR